MIDANAVWARILRAYPHVLGSALCLGLTAATELRAPRFSWALAPALALTAAAVEGRARVVVIALALVMAGWWWGTTRVTALDASILVGHVGETRSAVVVVTGPVRRGMFRLRMPAQVTRFGRLRLRESVLLELPLGRAPPQGGILRLAADVRRPDGEKHGFDEAAWLHRQGIQVVVHAYAWELVARRGGVGGVADRLRAWLVRSLAPGIEGERRAVLAGVVLGADEGLSDELRDRFRASGLYHLLAVSGQNVAIIAGGVLLLAWLLGVPRWLGEVAVLAAIGGYVLAVGFQPSVVRAGVAGALTSLAWLAARPRDRWYFLLVGAAILLAANPYYVHDPGFRLSFTAVAAIFVAVPRLQRLLEGYPLPRVAVSVVAVSLACSVATAPIVLLDFGSVPVYSVLANALAEPVVAPLLVLGLMSAVLEPLVPPAALGLAWVNGWLAAYLAFCAKAVGALPHAQVASPKVLLLLVAMAASIAALGRLRRPRTTRLIAVVALILAAVVAWNLRPASTPPPGPAGLRITFLDVGQGDAALLQVPQGGVLVDEGPPEADVAGQLRRLGVRGLAAIVLTHPQRDHVGGAASVLAELPVGLVLDPRLPVASWDEREAIAAARAHGVRVIPARAGQEYRIGKLELRVLWPTEPGPPGEDPNEHATVLLASYGQVDALLTADAESDVTAPLRPPPVEILKVAHHGSADERLPELLSMLRPQIAVISVGRHNDYGHPARSTLAELERAPALSLYRTDRDGRVVVESDGERLWVRKER
ncbi:MAG: DNA internalization-related competence protein ComEC/Rec2 [Actinomycetota bacterium]|nr:DNA internalization-related competence protein ComEC/Rec2 [Actinomycetota bacterium]